MWQELDRKDAFFDEGKAAWPARRESRDLRGDFERARDIFFADLEQRAIDRAISLQRPMVVRRSLRLKSTGG